MVFPFEQGLGVVREVSVSWNWRLSKYLGNIGRCLVVIWEEYAKGRLYYLYVFLFLMFYIMKPAAKKSVDLAF